MKGKVINNIYRTEAYTKSERLLKNLADRSFLPLWSYSNVFREQGRSNTQKEGKELCDLLVVFQDHIIIFSDKECEFPDSGDLEVDWGRWYRKAIKESAKQIYGAERWIKKYPNKIFLDKACTVPFPVPLPEPSKAKFHRIAVAHGASKRCKAELGGSGSLLIAPDIIGDEHINGQNLTVFNIQERGKILRPFTIGQIDPSKGFVHILDDTTLKIVLTKLDTITDFLWYLEKKESLILSENLAVAAGEEDLLAYYLKDLNDEGFHDFVIPPGTSLAIGEGFWEKFCSSSEAKSQERADRISYAWDHIISTFIKHIEGNTLYSNSHEGLAHHFKMLGFLAREPRLIRRSLAKSLSGLLVKKLLPGYEVAVRTLPAIKPGEPFYLFLTFIKNPNMSEIDYRLYREKLLLEYCNLTRLRYSDALDIVGYATEPGLMQEERSDDLLYLDGRSWTKEDEEAALEFQKGINAPDVEGLVGFQAHEDEYPVPRRTNLNVGTSFVTQQFSTSRYKGSKNQKDLSKSPASRRTKRPRIKNQNKKRKPKQRAMRTMLKK